MKRRILWTLAITLLLTLALAIGVSANETLATGDVADIFEFKGYSVSPFGEEACVGFEVNFEAKQAYEAQLGKTVNIGIVFASVDRLGGRLPLDKNGNPITLEQGKVVAVSLNKYKYSSYDFKLTGFTESTYDMEFLVSPYMYDGENVYYYNEDGASKDVEGVSYNDIIEEINAKDHSFAEIVSSEFLRTEASCTTDLTYYKSCTRCGYVSSDWFAIKNTKLDHTIVTQNAVAPTCTGTGLSQGSYCSVCNTVFEVQEVVPATGHNNVLVSGSVAPTLTSAGKKITKCSACGVSATESVNKLTASKITKDRIYSITTGEYNPALNNVWKVVDGNITSSGIYSAGNDWFGNVGDVLTITLDQEMYLSSIYAYVAGNYTFANITVKNAQGVVTGSNSVLANDCANGGEGKKIAVLTGKNILAYTIEVEITSLKWESARTFKLAELEMQAADIDLSFDHTHVYRNFVEQPVAPTCQSTGEDTYACYCGKTTQITVPMLEHAYGTLTSVVESTCTTNGKEIYTCDCGRTKEVTLVAKGHIYERFVRYTTEPTISRNGSAVYQCIGCSLQEQRVAPMLPLEDLKYLRVAGINGSTVTLKFNVLSAPVNYEVRYSTSEITGDNFEGATSISATVTGESEITVVISLNASINNCYYVAIRPYSGDNVGEVYSIRVGGNKLIAVTDDARVYHGETLSSFKKLFDEQTSFDEGVAPSSALSRIFTDTSDTLLYGMYLAPIVDLEYKHFVSNVNLYYASSGKQIKVRWSKTPVDFKAEDSAWEGCYTFTAQAGWNTVSINCETRYIQVVFEDGFAPVEMTIYGYQSGEGDPITLTNKENVTIGDMMGMCGFVAGGGGNTPINSVICSTVLREYHNFGWSYDFDSYTLKPSKFESSWMCNFDSQYRDYTNAGLNVVPCIQWNLLTIPVSNKVDENNIPIVSADGKYTTSNFFDRFNPHTYFMYADSMFAIAARYGSNSSEELLRIASQRTIDKTQVVGLNYIRWIELGNEPDGSWNGVHYYYSAYQYAALLSAGYDGHCSTLISTVLKDGYHFGVKNADPNMGVAMAGIAAADCNYVNSINYWMMANRADGKVAYDAFNGHHYMAKQVKINGNTFTVGISPEEGNLVGVMSHFVNLRDKYYSDKEVWITEFGWDTNQSYTTETSAHAYGNYTGRQVQAMWLTRAYLLLSSCGVDKATMYMCEDGGIDSEVSGKYGTCGVIGFERDENGNTVEVKKDSYYYMYTLKNTLGDYSFKCEIEAYDENVMIYQYETKDGRVAYAVWCPTSDGTVSENYLLKIDSKTATATLVEAVYGDIDGVKTQLTSDDIGYVSINVSENPVYVVVD